MPSLPRGRFVFHPLIVAAYCGTIAAALHLHPPVAIDNTLQFLPGAAALWPYVLARWLKALP